MGVTVISLPISKDKVNKACSDGKTYVRFFFELCYNTFQAPVATACIFRSYHYYKKLNIYYT
jgi:hypothetical protein